MNPYRFGIPGAGDPDYASVKLLLHGDGADGSTTFTDNSPSPKTPSVFGNARIRTAQSKFGGASMFFDGAGDYIAYTNSTDWDGLVHTVEMWVYPTALGYNSRISGQSSVAGGSDVHYLGITASNEFQYAQYTGSGYAQIFSPVNSAVINTWHHIACTSDGSNIRLFLNGVLQGTVACTAIFDSTTVYAIGRHGDYNNSYFTGYIDDFRFTKGVARYSGSFTPPTEAYPNFGTGDPHYNSVSLLLHMDGSHGSTVFTDNSPTPKTMTANNGAAISTAQSVFGGASCSTDGVDDYIDTPDHADFTLGSGDFTYEGRVRFPAAVGANNQWLLGQCNTSAGNTSGTVYIGRLTNGILRGSALSGSTGIGAVGSISALSSNTWYSWAYTRSGNTFYFFLDGVLQNTITEAGAINDSTNKFAIGRVGEFATDYSPAFQDEIRITKGVCRYTANYTPATAPFPNSL